MQRAILIVIDASLTAFIYFIEIKILVTGFGRKGKMTLVNSTQHISNVSYCKYFFDSPDHDLPKLDESKLNQTIAEIKKNCGKVNLVLYCTRCLVKSGDDYDVSDDDKYALRKFTLQFGHQFWKNAIIAVDIEFEEDLYKVRLKA